MMRLGELLTAGRIHAPLEAESVGEALLRLLPEEEVADRTTADAEALSSRLSEGDGGTARFVPPAALVMSLRAGETDEAWAALGVTEAPIRLDATEDPDRGVRLLVLVRLPRRPGFGRGGMERLIRVVSDPSVQGQLVASTRPDEVREVEALMQIDLAEALKVADVLTPLGYRVFPSTPADEVADLMARKDLRFLPVVDEDLQVVGMVTATEALRLALERGAVGTEERSAAVHPQTAGDMMSRAVLCVSEDQDLLDAAKLMAKREVGQLPVVRDGEIVGVLGRDAVLKAISGYR